MQLVNISDGSREVNAVWFNQPFLVRSFKPGSQINLAGIVDWWERKPAFISPEYEFTQATSHKTQAIHTARLVPIYPETHGISSKWLRSRIASSLENLAIQDPLPTEIIKTEALAPLETALKSIHFPDRLDQAILAKSRIAFDELFYLQLHSQTRKLAWKKFSSSHSLSIDQEKISSFISNLPFNLTSDQATSVKEILSDLANPQPMNRLLEGDVGSGKTVVAAIAIFASYLNGKKSILMAPTQILATQHYNTLKTLFSPWDISVSLITSTSSVAKQSQISGLLSPKEHRSASLKSQILVGTHSLLHQKALEADPDIALVIVDEQQRFGVKQRAHFLHGKNAVPHFLTMTATPIPRTVALTIFGDLDLSQIKSMPLGRQKITTWVVPSQKRVAAYSWIKKTIQENSSQAFIVCPFIDPSESQSTVKAASKEFARLQREVFSSFRLDLIHGRLKAREKDGIMAKMNAGKIDILVATPVVEVGIDLPKASIILIEDAEKFGLAQLHQLRGRVGRNGQKSYCLLFSSQPEIPPRLKAMETTNSGIELAELDLKLRGPGEIYGTSQHGFMPLKAASYSDLALIEKTKEWAVKIATKLDNYPALRESLKTDTILEGNLN